MLKRNFNINHIDKNEVWRYLGRKNQEISPEIESLTDEIINETLKLAKPMAVYERGILEEDNGLKLLNIHLSGEAIKDLLKLSKEAYVFAVTLGLQLDNRIKQYEIIDMTKAILMDACASVLAEAVCDSVNEEIDSILKSEHLYSTERFSPGYSDLSLEVQPEILTTLDTARKIGLSSSRSHLLFPRKSVTAIIGVLEKPREPRGYICKDCILLGNCKFGICRRKI